MSHRTKHATRHLSPTVQHRLPLTSALATASVLLLLAACASPRSAEPEAAGSPARPDVAFVSNRDGNFEIYLLAGDTTEPVNLTRNPALDYWLCWAPDGERLAFGSNRDGAPTPRRRSVSPHIRRATSRRMRGRGELG